MKTFAILFVLALSPYGSIAKFVDLLEDSAQIDGDNENTGEPMQRNDDNLKNAGKDCWGPCNSQQGPCDYCGTGLCCRKGWDDHSKSCDGSIGGDGYHTCVALDVVYRIPIKEGACAIDVDGSAKFHERCQCTNSHVSVCKQHCDQDQNCLGYVGPTKWDACQFATTSECPSDCSKYDQGHTGHLLPDQELSSSNYPGCHVKIPEIPDYKLALISGKSIMEANGWSFNIEYDNENHYPHWDQPDSLPDCGESSYYGWRQWEDVGTITTTLKGHGRMFINFGNCWDTGYVAATLNGDELKRVTSKARDTVSFHYKPGDVLQLKDVDTAIIKLYSIWFEEVFPEDCKWNDWQIGDCSQTCNGGTRTNTRTKQKEAAHGGVCEGEATMQESCNTQSCPPIHCQWDDWDLGECSETCGVGTRINTRTKLIVEEHGGTCTGQPTEIETCNTQECPVHCEWDEWQIGDCDQPCGGGLRTNTRAEKVEANHGGEQCAGVSTIVESCNVHECPVDCVWGEWNIGVCSNECGGGHQINIREVIQEELFGGKPCEGDASVEEECNMHNCPENCEWNEWQLGECSVSCGGGTRMDTRTKAKVEAYGGTCEDNGNQREVECNIEECPPIHCVWDDWIIGECSKTCGTGTRIDTRVKLVEEANGGTCSGQSTETKECKIQKCPVHCEWDEWQVGECSESCGGGNMTKTREEKVSASHGGNKCDGLAVITESCNVQECPVDCEWNEWVVGECSEECGDGIQTMTRTIKVSEQFYGKPCEGETLIEEPCFVKECAPCEDKNQYCPTYVHYYRRFCEDTPSNQWFIGEDGRYGCRESCGLC